MQMSTARYTIATSSPFPSSEFIPNRETWTSSVGYNVNYITLAGKFFYLLFVSMSSSLLSEDYTPESQPLILNLVQPFPSQPSPMPLKSMKRILGQMMKVI